jgi:hypothetical protein
MMKRLVTIFPALLFVLLAGCTGPISSVSVGVSSTKQRGHFIAGVDRIAGQAGLRALPDKPPDITGSTMHEYRTAAGKDPGIGIFWNDQDIFPIIIFPDDGSLEALAVKISDYAAARYGKENVSINHTHPLTDWFFQDWDSP